MVVRNDELLALVPLLTRQDNGYKIHIQINLNNLSVQSTVLTLKELMVLF